MLRADEFIKFRGCEEEYRRAEVGEDHREHEAFYAHMKSFNEDEIEDEQQQSRLRRTSAADIPLICPFARSSIS